MPGRPPLILLLCKNEAAANTDRRMLREAGFPTPQVMTSGAEAARLLAGQEDVPVSMIPDIAICQLNLDDMDAIQFCSIVRQHPRLNKLPILLILPNNSETEQLKTIDSGANSVLARPFSVDMLKKTLDQLIEHVPAFRTSWLAEADANADAFDSAVITQGILLRSEKSPADFFKLGIKLLNEEKWNLAIAAFQKALQDPEIKAEVAMGLAAACRGIGNINDFKKWLSLGCDTFISQKRWKRARSAFAKLLQLDPGTKNPFLSEAHKLIRQGAYEDAAQALAQGHALLPKMQVAERYARACLNASDPFSMYEALEEELEKAGEMAFLGSDIKENLDALIKQREERQREMAAERAAKLARDMGWQTEDATSKEAQTPLGQLEPPVRQEKLTQAIEKLEQNKAKKEFIPVNSAPARPDVVEEFAVSAQPEDDLFQGRSLFSDFLSMMKLTWRLSKKSGKT